MTKTPTLEFHVVVNAAPAEVYLALTRPAALRQWFCDTALIEPRKRSAVYFAWNSGYYAAGEVTRLKADSRIVFTWHGRGEPDPTTVAIAIVPEASGSRVTVRHAGLGNGKKWKTARAAIARGWERGLENLASVLADGQDLRYTQRPLLGLDGYEALTPDVAARLGVPVEHGVWIHGTMPGLAAASAGLEADDVLVSIAGRKVDSPRALITVLDAYRAGDTVALAYYRRAEKRQPALQLAGRFIPQLPGNPAVLAEMARRHFAQTNAELSQALAGLSPAAASARSATDEWRVPELLAHLLHHERGNQAWIAELVADTEGIYTNRAEDSLLRIRATANAFGSVVALFRALQHNQSETVAMLAALPDEFVARKRSFWRLALWVAQAENADHARDHLRQLAVALAGAADDGAPDAHISQLLSPP